MFGVNAVFLKIKKTLFTILAVELNAFFVLPLFLICGTPLQNPHLLFVPILCSFLVAGNFSISAGPLFLFFFSLPGIFKISEGSSSCMLVSGHISLSFIGFSILLYVFKNVSLENISSTISSGVMCKKMQDATA